MVLVSLPILFVIYLYSGAAVALVNAYTRRLVNCTAGAAWRGWTAGSPVARVAPPSAIPCPRIAEVVTVPLALALPADPVEAAEAILASVGPDVRAALASALAPQTAPVAVQEPIAPTMAPESTSEEIASPAPSGGLETASLPLPTSVPTADVYVRVNKKYRKANAEELTSLPDTALYAKLAGKVKPGQRAYIPLAELSPNAEVA